METAPIQTVSRRARGRRCSSADSLALKVRQAIGHITDEPAKRSRLEYLLKMKTSRCRTASIKVGP